MSISIILLFLAAFWILGRSLSGQGAFGPLKIADYARNAGFSGTDLVTAVAIAYAESSGNPDAVGDSGTSYGLWQIHYTVHPETYTNDPTELFDPQKNANAAFSIFQAAGNSFRPWSTFTNGMYQSHLQQANQEVST